MYIPGEKIIINLVINNCYDYTYHIFIPGVLGTKGVYHSESPQNVSILSENHVFVVDISITNEYAAAITGNKFLLH